MDPVNGTVSPRLRRQVLRQAVRENVDVKEGKRTPRRRARPWLLVLALAGAVPGVAAVLLTAAGSARLPTALAALLPVGGEVLPESAAAPGPAANLAMAGVGGDARVAQVAAPALEPRLVAQPDPIDRSVFPVGVRRIVLDPGHGGRDLGTVTAEGTPEKDLALDIAKRLAALLRQRPGIEVLLTREADHEVVLKDRAKFANDNRADLFVSIHLNWLQPASNRGVETFFLGATQDPYLVQLASRENRESGYALGDVRRLLDGIYLDLRQQE